MNTVQLILHALQKILNYHVSHTLYKGLYIYLIKITWPLFLFFYGLYGLLWYKHRLFKRCALRKSLQWTNKLTQLVSKTTDIPENASLTDIHCTYTVPHCTAHWYILYITVHHCTFLLTCTYSPEQHCTFILTCTVQYWTTLYVLTDSYCTALNHTVQETDIHSTLLNTVQHWAVIQTHTVHYCTVLNKNLFFFLYFLFFFLIKSI